MDINELTVGQITELKQLFGGSPCQTKPSPVFVGQKVFIRTVTYHLIGSVSELCGKWVKLNNPSWVASSGRWNVALRDGTLDEVELCGDFCWVNLDSAVDIHPWEHPLPTESK